MHIHVYKSMCIHVLLRVFIWPHKYILNTVFFDEDTKLLGSH